MNSCNLGESGSSFRSDQSFISRAMSSVTNVPRPAFRCVEGNDPNWIVVLAVDQVLRDDYPCRYRSYDRGYRSYGYDRG